MSIREPLLSREPREPVLPHALALPCFNKLAGKRVVLASASPRRAAILATYGLAPEIHASTFPEELSHGEFDTAGDYAVATATAKAVEVYEELVSLSPDDPPDLVIGGTNSRSDGPRLTSSRYGRRAPGTVKYDPREAQEHH